MKEKLKVTRKKANSTKIGENRFAAAGKVPSDPGVLQAVLDKIATEMLFGNAPLEKLQTTVLAADRRPAH